VTETRRPGNGDSAPIFAPRKGPAVLCLHGFTGTPYEIAPIAHALVAADFSVFAPVLAGHGNTATALAATSWQDWLASAEAAFEKLRAASGDGPVAVVGFSMGGLLALRMARLYPEAVVALVTASVPLRLPPWRVAVAKAWGLLPGFLRRSPLATISKRGGSDVTDDHVRRECPSLQEMPLSGVAELVRLAELVRHDLGLVKQPTLVVHGERDHTVPMQASYELAGSLASDIVERLWLPRSAHLVGVDVERAHLAQAVVEFLGHHTHPTAKAASEASPA